MRTLLLGLWIALIATQYSPPRAMSAEREWTDLLAHNLRDWTRTGDGKNPWRLTAEGSLVCEKGNELYTPDREFADGTFKFEYRFRPNGEKTGFKAAVWARQSRNGFGCRVALGDNCGALSATFQGASDRTKSLEEKPLTKAARPIGEWNQVLVVLEGRMVNVSVNDKLVASFSQSDTTKGLISLEAEGSTVEFRDVMWKNGK